ncbi:MAG: phage integrase SAM-like domain-containing protein [Candidatus Azobacteroides sp.]|nr:phage integrase SAM-like domain-containing protein [Candidatus Azobacteroides sp.]
MRFHFRPSARPGMNEGSLFIRFIHEREVKDFTTTYRIFPYEWNAEQQRLVLPEENSPRWKYLTDINDRMLKDQQRFFLIVKRLKERCSFSVEDVVGRFHLDLQEDHLSVYVEKLSLQMVEKGHSRTARAYRTAVNSLINFTKGKDIRLEQINSALLRRYVEFLKAKNLQVNSISFLIRNLRSIYNKAVKDQVVEARNIEWHCYG